MTLDAGSRKPPVSEKDHVWNRYWSYHCGSIIPEWLGKMVGEEALWVYHERIFYKRKHASWTEDWFYFGCAIELEHREASAQTLRELRRLVARVRHAGYDFTAARLLDAEVTRLQRLHTQETHRGMERWQHRLHQDLLKADPSYGEVSREIEAKKLPQGAAANLTLMRKILGAEEK